MAWTNITNAQLAIGAPLRSIDILALRDNITAQANGDAGAPKQQTAGIADSAVTAPKINFVANGLRNNSNSLDIACPSFNTVGSYSLVGIYVTSIINQGDNYSAGTSAQQVSVGGWFEWNGWNAFNGAGGLSGTWKLMSSSFNTVGTGGANQYQGLGCRVA